MIVAACDSNQDNLSYMQYHSSAKINSEREAAFSIRSHGVPFGVLKEQQDLPNPAELLLGAFAACCLKNVQRFSEILGFSYDNASIEVTGERQEKPTKIAAIRYTIQIDGVVGKLNAELLHKNLRKFGTIYNTLKETCDVSGELLIFP
ncbi:OsmC family protein [Neolewinella agarilytica]|uniref:Uncharacterized OsmC-related protein n=1 Tax=Neolewinella agarilytica TaxID=478744 RepID=A0A1H9KXW3_9BACT|nr:OsmC family protein [Neolewinella agarilytica]SER03908.1 Uncharacterized OsmC-related protein [Neolewinella agarilytica]